MLTTLKLCNVRDCLHGNFDKSDFVNPCSVYKNLEDEHWYDEMTGKAIRRIHMEGGGIDVEAWLDNQLAIAIKERKRGMPVHQATKLLKPRIIEKPKANIPEVTCEYLDKTSAQNIRDHREKAIALNREINIIRTDIHSYVKIGKKFGFHPTLNDRIRSLRQTMEELKKEVEQFTSTYEGVKLYIEEDDRWVGRWKPRTGCITERLLVFKRGKDKFEIDRNGLALNYIYEFLPDNDCDYERSISEAKLRFGILPEQWEEFHINVEYISKPIRKLGKKNSIGARIRARADNHKTAMQAKYLLRALCDNGFPVDDLKEIYDKKSMAK